MLQQRSITYDGQLFTLRGEENVLWLFDEHDNLVLGWPVPTSLQDNPLSAKRDEEVLATLRRLVGTRHNH